jgi:hypothetical protein
VRVESFIDLVSSVIVSSAGAVVFVVMNVINPSITLPVM